MQVPTHYACMGQRGGMHLAAHRHTLSDASHRPLSPARYSRPTTVLCIHPVTHAGRCLPPGPLQVATAMQNSENATPASLRGGSLAVEKCKNKGAKS